MTDREPTHGLLFSTRKAIADKLSVPMDVKFNAIVREVESAVRERLAREECEPWQKREPWNAVTARELGLEYVKPARQEQEPVAWINWSALTGQRRLGWQCESEIASEPLYTAPQPREWRGLTEEEIDAADKSVPGAYSFQHGKAAFARAIEAKLREKNDA